MQLLNLLKTTTKTTTAKLADAVFVDDGPFFDLEFPLPSKTKQNFASLSLREIPHFSSDTNSDSYSSDDEDEEELIFYKDHVISLGKKPLKSSSMNSHMFNANFHRKEHKTLAAVKPVRDDTKSCSSIARDNSARSSLSSRSARMSTDVVDGLPKDSIHGYLNKLYVRVTKVDGKGQSLKFPEGLKGMYMKFRRSKSARVASARSPTLQPAASRRDDSLLEQQDGIQSAIAHCKRSLTPGPMSPLMRSRSYPREGIKTGL